jgi:PIN domain-containing protein
MGPQKVVVFPDTNLFLHYRPLNEIDWRSLLQTGEVEIEIAPVVTRELEQQKTLHQSRKIRDRAATALKFLHSQLKIKLPRIVRDGVTLDFLVKEPSPDFAASRGLNLQLGDDWLIGTLLLYREDNPHSRCLIVTHDLPLTVKATHCQIELLEPSETLLLPSEPDETEKKLRQAQAELLQYKSREPVLDVRFESGEDYATFQITRQDGDSESEVRSMLEVAKQEHPLIETKPPQGHPGALMGENNPFLEIAESVRDAATGLNAFRQNFHSGYNARMQTYYRDYEKYLRDAAAFRALALRTIKIDLVLGNTGTCPAEDIHVLLHFPDGFTLYDEEHSPEPPEEPGVPSMEQTMFPNLSLVSPYADFHLPRPRDPSLPRIRKTNSYEVTFEYEKLQHRFIWHLTTLFAGFDSWESANSFSIDYTVNAGNMMAEQEGKLGVIIQKV